MLVNLRAEIAECAREQSLDLAGIVRAQDLAGSPDVQFYAEWVERGFAGEMNYLKGEKVDRRADVSSSLAGAKTVICVALNYNTANPKSIDCADPSRGWISRYAWGADYHEVLKTKLEAMLAGLKRRIERPFEAKVYVDTGPVLERAFARQTALGWQGKNTCLIHQGLGSWLFLGEILTTLEIPPDAPATDRCGSCTKCIDACPTQAILAPRVLDSTRCISYWTIEFKGIEFKGNIPADVASGLGRHVFGCDICQDVCPWNRRAPATTLLEFQPRPGLLNPPLEELAQLSEEDFRILFRNSPVKRLGYRRFLRNVQAALQNLRAIAPASGTCD